MADEPYWHRFALPFSDITKSGGLEPCPFGSVICPEPVEVEVEIDWRGCYVSDRYMPTIEEVEELERAVEEGRLTLAEAQAQLDALTEQTPDG